MGGTSVPRQTDCTLLSVQFETIPPILDTPPVVISTVLRGAKPLMFGSKPKQGGAGRLVWWHCTLLELTAGVFQLCERNLFST